jgi:enoyl-CoA hydratase
MSDTIQFTQQNNGVAIITFNRPQALNALNLEAMATLKETISRLVDDATLRAVILTGAGEKAFCSGGDLIELSQRTTEAEAREFITTMGDALLALERLPVPVIAAINGYALGGGSEIALACDMRIVDANVKMGMVQIKMAVTPGWGAGQRLLRLVGYAKALEIILRGDVLRADDLLSLGLANRIVAIGQALVTAQNLADEIASQPPDVVRGIKSLLQAGLNQPYDQALQSERDIFPLLWVADAHVKAVENFLKRHQSNNDGE